MFIDNKMITLVTIITTETMACSNQSSLYVKLNKLTCIYFRRMEVVIVATVHKPVVLKQK